ncbi:MAG: SurA N-terminal domain-containing protein, partial [Nitrospinae bacterium]|nr:SurA N-terminal domain-containing protein [Nitrospinota bacterium]
MLTWIREAANSLAIKILFFLIALSFIGASFMLWGDLGPGRPNVVATVDGVEITDTQYQAALRQVDEAIRGQFGGQIDPQLIASLGLGTMAMATVVDDALQQRAAEKAGIVVTDAQVADAVMAMPDFQREGVFDQARYTELLQMNGLSPASFEARVRQDLLVRRLRTLVERTAVVTDAEAYAWYQFQNQPVTVTYARVSSAPLSEKIAPTDEQLAAWYKANAASFEIPEKRSFRVLTVDADAYGVTAPVSDAELKEYFETNPGLFAAEEKVKARHILVQVVADADDDTVAAGRAKIDAARARIEKGEPFEAVAKDVGEDPSAPQGGDLGEFGRGMMVPEFETVAFSSPVGVVSEPFRSQFGWHIVKVEAHNDAATPTFEGSRDQILEKVRGAKGRQAAHDFVQGLAGTVTPEKFAAVTDTNPAVRINSYTLSAGVPGEGESMPEAARAAIFALTEKQVTPIIETADGYAIALLDRIEPPTTPELSTVTSLVAARYRAEKGREEAEKIATAIEKEVNEGAPLADAARKRGIEVTVTAPFTRQDLATGAVRDEGMVPEAFDLSAFEARTTPLRDDFLVYTVSGREPLDIEKFNA